MAKPHLRTSGELAYASAADKKLSSGDPKRMLRTPPRALRRPLHYLPAILVPVAVIIGWQLYCTLGHEDPTVLPSPSRVLVQTWDFRSLAWMHTRQTLLETAVGFSISIAFAIVVAVLMDQAKWLRRGLYPMLVASQTIPIIAIAPLMIIWFGFGLLPKVLVIILATFFPMVVALLDGLASTDPEAMSLLRTMGAGKRQTFTKVRFPNALPHFFTGIRIAATYAVVAAIFAEYVGAYNGLGIWMELSKNAFRTDLVFGAIVITALLSITLFSLVHVVSRLTIPWYHASRKPTT
jgi:ABC-type nitrate/sulfonate/bicarbonate transport system permease component